MPEASTTPSPTDKLAARGPGGKASRVAKQRAIARGVLQPHRNIVSILRQSAVNLKVKARNHCKAPFQNRVGFFVFGSGGFGNGTVGLGRPSDRV